MVDVVSRSKRSEIMSRIGGKNTAPEIRVRRVLHALGFRFRLHAANLSGKPDIVLSRHRKVIFVHGCFWHGHRGCKRGALPTSNVAFWTNKIRKNKSRDRTAQRQLQKEGWSVLVLWQCQINDAGALVRHLTTFLGRKRTRASRSAAT
jgi:DNA mismatch endonuclease, patch repair protein